MFLSKPVSDNVHLRGFFKWNVPKPSPPPYKVEELAAEFAHSLHVFSAMRGVSTSCDLGLNSLDSGLQGVC